MTNHALVGRKVAGRVAGQVRAELARKNKTAADMAKRLNVTPQTAGRRLSGKTDFTVTELVDLADWLEVDATVFFQAAS